MSSISFFGGIDFNAENEIFCGSFHCLKSRANAVHTKLSYLIALFQNVLLCLLHFISVYIQPVFVVNFDKVVQCMAFVHYLSYDIERTPEVKVGQSTLYYVFDDPIYHVAISEKCLGDR